MLGSWKVNVSMNSMPEKIATAVGDLSSMVGAEYSPIAYLGSQLVNGTNHAVLAEQTLVLGKDVKNIVVLIFHETTEGVTLSNIERIIEGGSGMGGTQIKVETGDVLSADIDAMKVFNDTFAGFCGSKITPFALLATQVVRGMDYIFACELTPIIEDEAYAEKKVMLVTVNNMGSAPQLVNLLNSTVRTKSEETLKAGLRLSAPWTLFYREVNALFEKDPEVKVLYNYEEPELKIVVKGNDEKAAVLGRFIPTEKKFGNVTLNISVVGDDGQPVPDVNLPDEIAIEKAFAGNEALSFVKHVQTVFQDNITYVVFKKEVVQYFADNTSDLYGAISTLYQNIAVDVFADTLANKGNFLFCTDVNDNLGYAFTWLKNANVSLGKPLGEWP